MLILSNISKRRLWILKFLISSFFLIVFYQLLQLMVFHQPALKNMADKQHTLNVVVPPFRGAIFDRTGKEFATNLRVPSIYAVPRLIADASKPLFIQRLHEILGMDKNVLKEKMEKDKSFVWLKRQASFEEAQKIRQLKTPVVGVIEDPKRFYPQGDLISQILGYTNIDNQGIEGYELYLNKDLQGQPGSRLTRRDALGREVKAFEKKLVPAIDGHSITLTIDQHIQYLTERALERSFTQWHAKGATAIVMNPYTGEILALANRPTFDPNRYQKASPDARRNRSITDMYEPGSVFKIVTVSAALNEGTVTPERVFNCENGHYYYGGGRVLHDVHSYGKLSVEEIVIKSSNIGSVKIGATLDQNVFFDYVKRFGFGKSTGIDFPGEASGFCRPPSQWSKTSPYNIPIGHEIMVTALQITTAMAVLANGGNLVKPYLISKIQDQQGVTLKENHPVIKHRVIREEVAYKMRKILERVVNEGTGKSAKIDEIPTGGKTGTAQKVLPGGRGYSHSSFMSSFVGMAPIEHPELVMAVVIDDAHPAYYGGTVAAPVFKEVIEPALLYLGYVPENPKLLGGAKTEKPSSLKNQPKPKQDDDSSAKE